MAAWRALCETVHIVALALWLGVVVAAGASAAIIFPAMKELGPRLPEYGAYTGDHWRIAGGEVAQRVFLMADVVQFVCAIVAAVMLLTLVLLVRVQFRRAAMVVRSLALAVAIASLASMLLVVTPRFNAAVERYHAQARAGNNEAALVHKAAADEVHPIASRLLGLTAASVLIALIAGVRMAAVPGREWGATATGGSRYEEPALLKGRGR